MMPGESCNINQIKEENRALTRVSASVCFPVKRMLSGLEGKVTLGSGAAVTIAVL